MINFEMNELHHNFTLLVTLLSFQSPFDFYDHLEEEVSKYLKFGNVILDEYAHNSSKEKRFISFKVHNGKICRDTFSFESICDDDVILKQSNKVLIRNKNILIEQGVDLDEMGCYCS